MRYLIPLLLLTLTMPGLTPAQCGDDPVCWDLQAAQRRLDALERQAREQKRQARLKEVELLNAERARQYYQIGEQTGYALAELVVYIAQRRAERQTRVSVPPTPRPEITNKRLVFVGLVIIASMVVTVVVLSN